MSRILGAAGAVYDFARAEKFLIDRYFRNKPNGISGFCSYLCSYSYFLGSCYSESYTAKTKLAAR